MSDALRTGAGIKSIKADRWLQAIGVSLVQGEEVEVLVKAGPTMSMVDLVAVTPLRVLLLVTTDHCKVKRQFAIRDIRFVEQKGSTLRVALADGDVIKVTATSLRQADTDATLLRSVIESHVAATPSAELQSTFDQARDARIAHEQQIEQAKHGLWSGATVVGSRVRSKAAQTIMAHAGPGEHPWLVIGSLGAGALAAFEDRLMLVKTGLVTGYMAGSLGGARVTTFNFRDITGIEYNAGMMNGVLEILTASYGGSANKDFWRGTLSGRNADANDPYTLSNTLPLTKAEHTEALPHLNELRRRINESREVQVKVAVDTPAQTPPAIAATDLAAQIASLKGLHDAGVLTDDEFVAAKARLLHA